MRGSREVGDTGMKIWTITALERIEESVVNPGMPEYGYPWTLGYYESEDAARYYVEVIAGVDVALFAYKWIVIERMDEGVYAESDGRIWYSRGMDGMFVNRVEPTLMARVKNFSMG